MAGLTFGEKVLKFNSSLQLKTRLPSGIEVMDPFSDPEVLRLSGLFYRKFYDDHTKRHFIIGINPGRFGAGVTGIPFTDTKRLQQLLGETVSGRSTHEPSSDFIYRMIDYLGGPEKFFGKYYINSIFPLTLIKRTKEGKVRNYNYYDSPTLLRALEPELIHFLKEQISFGIFTDKAYVLGTGSNMKVIQKLNDRYHFFDKLVPLEHPRYIIQYKRKEMGFYLEKYQSLLGISD